MTRVIHTGDTHIGYQQYHSPERRQDFLDAFEAVVADAIDDDVDAVIHAGDLFHDRRPDLQDLLGTLAALRTLADADIPFLAVVGNHESTRGGQWLDLFENLGLATRLGAGPYRLGDVAVYGLDHVPQSRRDDLAYDFEPHDAAHAVLVSHGLFTPFVHGNWDTETVLAESNVDFDALLLGDNHTPDTAEVAGTWVTYCGSTERASASERDERGYNIVEFGDDVDISRRSLDDYTRDFAFVSVDLGEGEGIERVRERVRQFDLDDAVAIVEITGEGEPVTPASVEEYAAEAGALIARVTDRREIEEGETDIDVSFADPDDAVRERVREMGLSTAARDVDETVRASKVADSNVRQEVETRVTDLLDSDDEAFSPAEVSETAAHEDESNPAAPANATDATDAADETDVEAEADAGETDEPAASTEPADDLAGDGPETAETADTDDASSSDTETAVDTADADTDGTETADDTPDTDADSTETADDTIDTDTDGTETADDTTDTDADSTDDTDSQVSMEDFL
ncbi:DNA double-strand break repair protein Mre11 [Salinirubrum litoreum]|uniref:DNA double-strand break repair protein Mre11 n=1 Tax=Salinirubrum litoreum TaxID=1126234 RepID=A0ABD5RBR9_9EURY|nr:DNA double-strand break repair protein Mre11 [Salinirubrum litoreum]